MLVVAGNLLAGGKNRTLNMKCHLQEKKSHPNLGCYRPLQLDFVIGWDIGDTG